MLTLDKVYKASHVLKEVIRETDLIKAPKLSLIHISEPTRH